MSATALQVSKDFTNYRGSYKVAGLLDVGTQASLVRLRSGKFVFLDACHLSPSDRRQVDELTNAGQDLEAILNVHPFHTLHVERAHEMWPQAALYGTARHLSRFPDLPWEELRTEDPALHERYSADFDFSVPRGVDFIPSDENLHFSSVLVLHRASKTIHVDDTFNYVRLPLLMRWMSINNTVGFHPTLAKVLEKRAGAAQDFRDWANGLIERWRHAENLCAAHTAALLAVHGGDESIHSRLMRALEKVEPVLAAHEEKYG
jgi:hypothetical protein